MTFPFGADLEQRRFAHLPRALAAGQSFVLDGRGQARVTIIASAGATVTVSRVTDASATTDHPDTSGNFTVTGGTRTTIALDWPFYRITTSGGGCRVAVG